MTRLSHCVQIASFGCWMSWCDAFGGSTWPFDYVCSVAFSKSHLFISLHFWVPCSALRQHNRGSLWSLALIHRVNTTLWKSLISATNAKQSLAASPWGNQVGLFRLVAERPNPLRPPAVPPLSVSLCSEWIANCLPSCQDFEKRFK